MFCEFLEHYPTLKAAQAATAAELTHFFRSHRVIRRRAMTRRIEQIATAGIPLTEDPGIVEAMQWLIQTLIGQLKPLDFTGDSEVFKSTRCNASRNFNFKLKPL